MKRLTGRKDGRAYIVGCPDFALPKIAGLIIQQTVDRLATIEDILGDEYDLDLLQKQIQEYREGRYIILKEPEQAGISRLRELAQADKLIGKTVWLTKWFTKNVQIANPPLQRTIRYISVCKNGEILMHLKDGAFPIQLIGDCAFTSQEEAKAALRREQDG